MKTIRHCKKHDKEYKIYTSLTKCPDCEDETLLASRDRAAEKRKQGKKEGLKGKEDDTKRRVTVWGRNRIANGERKSSGKKNGRIKETAKQAKTNRILSEIKKELLSENDCCPSCGCYSDGLELSHILPRSIRPDLVLHRENLMIQCHICHYSFEHKIVDKMALFLNSGDILRRLKILDEGRYNRLILKIRGKESLPEKIVGLLNGEHED